MATKLGLGGLIGAALVLAAVAHAHGDADHEAQAAFDETQALDHSQAAIGRSLEDLAFRDRRGRAVSLAGYRGKPLVLSLIYTSCYHTCPTITQSLAHAVEVAEEALGEASFEVATVGFDAAVDTPERMAAFAREQGIDHPRWRFLSADAATIEELSAGLGFIFYRSPKGFDHLTQTTILDADGTVYRQVYGDTFPAPQLVEPLKELVFGTVANLTSLSGLVNQVRLFCTIYDPSSERYRFDYSLFIGMIIGFASLATIGVVLVRAWRRA